MPLKVLLADDNMTAQRMGSKILTEAGYEVVAVSNGAAAVKKIASEKPGILILDVYMPGYTGLEVCEKVKNDPATTHVPVILTVTNMEPFNQQDGTRVRADGVLIKPFEATDLLAVLQKFEVKSAQAEPTPEYLHTQKMAAVEEFKDASYEEWKTEATEEHAAPKIEMSEEVGSAPALGFDEMPIEPASAPMPPEPPVAPAFGVEAATAFPGATPPMEQSAPAAEAPVEVAPPPELEFTSAPQVGEIEITQASELEVSSSSADAVIARDPALVTDADEMSQFATKVGAEHAEEMVVGIAMPGLNEAAEAPAAEEQPSTAKLDAYAEPAAEAPEEVPAPSAMEERTTVAVDMQSAFGAGSPEAEGAPAPAAEAPEEVPAPPAMEERTTVAVDMQGAFGAGPSDEAATPPPAAEPEPPPAPAPTTSPMPADLMAQFAAELDLAHKEREAMAQASPAVEEAPLTEESMAVAPEVPASQLDEDRIAAAVNRALEKYKDGLRAELIATIVRELKG